MRIRNTAKITDLHPVGEDPEPLIVEEEPAARLVRVHQQLGQPQPIFRLGCAHHQPTKIYLTLHSHFESKLKLWVVINVSITLNGSFCCPPVRYLLRSLGYLKYVKNSCLVNLNWDPPERLTEINTGVESDVQQIPVTTIHEMPNQS